MLISYNLTQYMIRESKKIYPLMLQKILLNHSKEFLKFDFYLI